MNEQPFTKHITGEALLCQEDFFRSGAAETVSLFGLRDAPATMSSPKRFSSLNY
jgi:hypothetical protein